MASARVVKREQAVPEGSAVVAPQPSPHDRAVAVRVLAEAEAQAAAIVAAAEAEAAALRAAAEREREALRQRLWEAALVEAQRQVEESLLADQRELLARLRRLVEQAVLREEEIRHAYAQITVELALAIAEVVIRREIERDCELLGRLIEAALKHAPNAPVTHLLVHPDEVERARQWLAQAWNGRPPIEVIGDPHIDRGSCVLGTPVGFVDARITTQLGEIRRALLEVTDEFA